MKILIIDDSESDADLVRGYISRAVNADKIINEAIQVDWDDSLEHGIEILKGNEYDLLILDLNLLDSGSFGSNLETLDTVLESGIDIPIVVLTGNVDTKLWSVALKHGAQDYLIKGEINPVLLLRTIYYARERHHLIKQLEQSNKELEDFAYIASHDLKEPLRKVINFGGRLKEKYHGTFDDRGKEYLDIMVDATQRMRSLLNALLEYARINTDLPNYTTLNLNSIIQSVVEDLETSIKETNTRIEITGELPQIEGEELLMKELFQNLINNSIKFRKKDESPLITITCLADKQEIQSLRLGVSQKDVWKIVIKDNGIGFDDDQAQQIFKQFVRIHGKDAYPGHGLGLSICKKIAQRYKGQIEAQGKPGEGSVFTITLPAQPTYQNS